MALLHNAVKLHRITDNDSIEFARVNYDHRGCDESIQ